jgi:hypothetical protein
MKISLQMWSGAVLGNQARWDRRNRMVRSVAKCSRPSPYRRRTRLGDAITGGSLDGPVRTSHRDQRRGGEMLRLGESVPGNLVRPTALMIRHHLRRIDLGRSELLSLP